jgi:hypothetical protein
VEIVDEKSPLYATFTFTDEDGAAVIPNSVDWRIDDITNGVQILDWQSVSVVTNPTQITVPGSDNAISDQTHISELRALTVRVDDGLPSEHYADKYYRIKNLHGVT